MSELNRGHHCSHSFCASTIIRVESNGEAVDGDAPVSSRKDLAGRDSLMLDRAPVGIPLDFRLRWKIEQ